MLQTLKSDMTIEYILMISTMIDIVDVVFGSNVGTLFITGDAGENT